jgi:hypothetical protein
MSPREVVEEGGGMALHRFQLGGTGWWVWRDALLRTTGFPASGLAALAAPQCAEAAEGLLDGAVGAEAFAASIHAATAAASCEVNRIAADPLLREAITWQSPAITDLLDSLLRNAAPIRRNAKRRYREEQLSRFWQRYCSKTETIGFFGPALWITLDPDCGHITAEPGCGLVSRRRVFLEPWAVVAFGEWLATDPQIKRWLPPARLPHHVLRGRTVLRPGMAPVQLTEAEAAVLEASDGWRPAALIAAELAERGLADDAGVRRLLPDLVARKLLTWDANLPLDLTCQAVLGQRIAAIAEDEVRARAGAGLRRLDAARDAVAAAAGDPAALAAAMEALDSAFTATTGRPPRRRAGSGRGRGLCYEETTRDLRLTIGGGFLEDLGPALGIVLQAARWLTVALAEAYETELHRLYRELSAAGQPVSLGDLWYPALSLFIGDGNRPLDAVLEDLASRWAKLIGLSEAPADSAGLRLAAAPLSALAGEIFPADRPGWSMGRVHSPDLMICAASPQAVCEGDYLVVLGELHAAFPAMGQRALTWARSDPDDLMRFAVADYGGQRVMPLMPTAWLRDAGRMVPFEYEAADRFLAFGQAAGADLDRTTAIAAVSVTEEDGHLVATIAGRRCRLVEAFSALLSMVAADAYKLATSTAEHTPRITLDRLVVFRETWRTTAGATDLLPVRDEAGEFLAARRWRRRLNLPERCFVKVATEPKPFYVDLSSPLFVSACCAVLRAACRARNGDVAVTVTEMLPDLGHAWVPGPGGERYFGELRLQVTDPRPAPNAFW